VRCLKNPEFLGHSMGGILSFRLAGIGGCKGGRGALAVHVFFDSSQPGKSVYYKRPST